MASNDINHPDHPGTTGDVSPRATDPTAISDHIQPATATGASVAGVIRDQDAQSASADRTAASLIEVGADVIGTCGHKIGEVVAVRDDHVVVEKGFFMPVDFYIPTSAIHHNNEHGLYLNVTKDEALHRGWDIDPVQPGPTS